MILNRQCLKVLQAFPVDAQLCQQYGAQVFNYQGEDTPEYQKICGEFTSVIDDIIGSMENIKSQVPVFSEE